MTAPVRKARFDGGNQHRRALIAKIHVAKKQLGLNDDDYRAVLLRVGGALSAADLSDARLADVIAEFGRKGFTAKARPIGTARPADHPVALKARALWISLHQLAAIDDPSEAALEAFARRQLGVPKLQWANQAHGYKLIEALKAMAERAGWSQDLAGVAPNAKLLILKRGLVWALWCQTVTSGLASSDWSLEDAAWEFGGIERDPPLMFADVQKLDLIARTFASKLAAFRAAGGSQS